MADDRDAIIMALEVGIMDAWDWAIVEDKGHQKSGRAMAEAALKCLETGGFKVVRIDAPSEQAH